MALVECDLVGDRLIYGEGTSYDEWSNWPGLDNLTPLDLTAHFPEGHRVLIVAPHPDDEILGCAGLMQQLVQLNREVVLVAVTNGTQSHPDSLLYTPEQLNHIRPAETEAALKVLGIDHSVQRIALNIMDGEVTSQQQQLDQALQSLIQPNDILVCTFEKDGHPDHEATGTVVKQLAHIMQLSCYQVLIWAWHWAIPNDRRIAWEKGLKLRLTTQQLALKKAAISCFKSQIETDSTTGQPPILSSTTIQRILMPCEVYICD